MAVTIKSVTITPNTVNTGQNFFISVLAEDDSWGTIKNNSSSWNDVKNSFLTWNAVYSNNKK